MAAVTKNRTYGKIAGFWSNLTLGKNNQHIKIYLPCNFEVNLITHLGVIFHQICKILILSEEKIFEKVYDVRRTTTTDAK
jgi:hypothetical protein